MTENVKVTTDTPRVAQLREKLKQAVQEIKNNEVIILPEDHLTGLPLVVYNIVRFGYIDSRGKELLGATDPELVHSIARDFDVRESTIRYARWRLEKQNYIEKSENTRRIAGKGRKSNVYVVSKKYQQIYEAINVKSA